MNKLLCLDLLILETSKVVLYKFWYDYVKQKPGKKSKIMLHGYRQLHTLHKNRYFKLWEKSDTVCGIETKHIFNRQQR